MQLFITAKDVNRLFKMNFPEDNQYKNINLEDLEYMLAEPCIQDLVSSNLDFAPQTWNFFASHGNQIANDKIASMTSSEIAKPERPKIEYKFKSARGNKTFSRKMLLFMYNASPSGVTENDWTLYAHRLFPDIELQALRRRWQKYIVDCLYRIRHKINIVRVDKGRYRLIYEGDFNKWLAQNVRKNKVTKAKRKSYNRKYYVNKMKAIKEESKLEK